MEIIRTRKELTEYVNNLKAQGQSLALVPTMGALHNGHLSLMIKAVAENDAVVASVFVNPKQFNDKKDLESYPRNEQADFALLESVGVSAVFAPAVEEIYPSEEEGNPVHVFDLGRVAEVMEGQYRPGHFQGVARIVSLLFRLVNPDRAYFGEKDFQQIAVIRRMAATEGLDNIEIIACPIHREKDGLAMSSRNVRLTPQQRLAAPGIHRVLAQSVGFSEVCSPEDTHLFVVEGINALPYCKVEYFSIVNSLTLEEVEDWNVPEGVTGCVTVYCGDVRLIDNICYRKPQ
ncbi:MAG: pantoate--beta-alanine ligase [Prevotella sp.]|nr:pantoate--beta-alanine ligase [Prevotella sp.]MCM1075625.1 pantoate--beta-alanine ligase [Ruminococcus sp.]